MVWCCLARHSVGRPAPATSLDLKASAFDPKEKVWTKFPSEGSKYTPPHQSCEFKWKDYCPVVFRLENLPSFGCFISIYFFILRVCVLVPMKNVAVFDIGLCGNCLVWMQQIICYLFVEMMLLGSYHLQEKVEAFST